MNNQSWMHGLKLGARQLWRDLRAGELRLLMVSVALAVAALTAVGFLADRMQSGLWRDARQLLGAMRWWSATKARPLLLCKKPERPDCRATPM
jgi:putative ABC transport system permease protein